MQSALPILYSFRRCPYAMRARLALAVSRQVRIHREVDLKQRPPELIAASAKGTVPVLVLPDGEVIEESYEIMLWALSNNDPEHWLPSSEQELARIHALVERCDGEFKRNLDRYKYASRQAVAEPELHREQGSVFLRELDSLLESSFFLAGDTIGLADMALAPFVRQFALADRAWFDAQDWVPLRNWLDGFLDSERFRSIMAKYDVWQPGSDPVLVDG